MATHDTRSEVNPEWAKAISEATPIIARLLGVLIEVLSYTRAPVTALEALAQTDEDRRELDSLSELVFTIHQLTDWDHGVIEIGGDWFAAWTGDGDAIARITERANAVVEGRSPAVGDDPAAE